MKKNEKGFTLIELVVVIVVIGILAALVVPRFISLQSEARVAVVDHLSGAVRSGSNIVHAKALTNGVAGGAAGTIDIDGPSVPGGVVAINFGYPVDTQDNISLLFDALSPRYSFTGGGVTGGSSLVVRIDNIADCQVTYTTPTVAGGAPTVVRVVSGC